MKATPLAPLFALALLFLLGCQSSPGVVSTAQLGEPIRTAQSSETTITGSRLQYQLSVPNSSAVPEDGWPLLLFLHGAGERGTQLELVGVHGPLKHTSTTPELRGAVIIAPQCPKGVWWDPKTLKILVDEICVAYPIDRDRLYVTGLSMGGYGTWALLSRFPDTFAAAVPICGGGDVQRLFDLRSSGFELEGLLAASQVPIRAFHGQEDGIIPVGESQFLIDALREVGSTASLTIYPGIGHDSWSKTYATPELYTWMFAQDRGAE